MNSAEAAVSALLRISTRNEQQHRLELELGDALDLGPEEPDEQSSPETPHPFAHTRSLLTVIHDDEHIDLEEERRFYEQFTDDRSSIHSRSRPASIVGDARSLYSADIVLGDQSGHSATFARDVHITGWATVGDKPKSAYVVYDCAITTKEGMTIHALKRFSAFEKLNSALRRALPGFLRESIPRLPPKAPLAKYRPAFLEKRRKMLQTWLLAVLLHPDIGSCPAVRDWLLQ